MRETFIRLRQNTLQLVGALRKSRLSGAAGMTRGAHAAQALAPRERLRCAMAGRTASKPAKAKTG
ncbi:hypothetical protein DRH13_02625 [Candidatus Woesebacteria bacterium]|nr:MAG: hypothetical protein DRH13_02625 [Candidatus Woesebacteria bacterium]